MKNGILILFLSLTISGCTIFGKFYIANKSDDTVHVTINVRSLSEASHDQYVIKVDDVDGKKIKFSTANRMDKRIIQADSINKQFHFLLEPNEFAYIGSGPNTRLFNVNEILIKQEKETTTIHGMQYSQFEIRRSGLFKYVGVKEIK